MTCFECGRDTLAPAAVHLSGIRHGESFTVETQGLQCEACGFKTIDNSQGTEFARLVSDAYRSAHGLLTSADIRNRRAQLGYNQQEFADYLGAGSASVKRWESGQIQEKAMDELIRLKTDPEAARKNLKTVERCIPGSLVLSTVAFGDRDVELTLAVGENSFYFEEPVMHMDPGFAKWASESAVICDESDCVAA